MSDQQRWYRDIRLDAGQQNYPALLSQLFHGLHACMSQLAMENGANYLGIGFPAWNSHGVGHLIRLVSINPAILEQIEYEPVIARLLESCRIKITPVDEVPEALVFAEFVYQRDRKPEKMTSGFIQRQNRRRERRQKPAIDASYSPKTIRDNHYVNLLSSENGHRFSLFIKRIDNRCEKVIAPYNRYGLADGGQKNRPTIPHFKTTW